MVFIRDMDVNEHEILSNITLFSIFRCFKSPFIISFLYGAVVTVRYCYRDLFVLLDIAIVTYLCCWILLS